jgi:hypothetical protein
MAFGFEIEPNLQVYGDGKGNIVFELWADDACTQKISAVSMSVERFTFIVEHHRELLDEAYKGVKVCQPD